MLATQYDYSRGKNIFQGRYLFFMGLMILSFLTFASNGLAQTGGVIADYQVTRTIKNIEDGTVQTYTTTAKYARSSSGLVGILRGNVALITDPKTGSYTAIDYTNKTFWKITPGKSETKKGVDGDVQDVKAVGTETIEGFPTTKVDYSFKNPDGSTENIVNYVSVQLGLILRMEYSDSEGGRTTQQYINITQKEPPASAFAVPANFRQVPVSQIQIPVDGVPSSLIRNCNLDISHNPLNLVSVIDENGNLSPAMGTMRGSTGQYCYISATEGNFTSPLEGYLDIGDDPYDDSAKWFVYDNGGAIGSLGATGSIGFTASWNGTGNYRYPRTKFGRVTLTRITIRVPQPCYRNCQ